MTNQEAIGTLKEMIDCCDAACAEQENINAIHLAIAALEEKAAKEEAQKRDDELFRSLKKENENDLADDLLRHAQAFETGGENGVTAESTAKVLRQAARTIKDQHNQLQRIAQDHITWEEH